MTNTDETKVSTQHQPCEQATSREGKITQTIGRDKDDQTQIWTDTDKTRQNVVYYKITMQVLRMAYHYYSTSKTTNTFKDHMSILVSRFVHIEVRKTILRMFSNDGLEVGLMFIYFGNQMFLRSSKEVAEVKDLGFALPPGAHTLVGVQLQEVSFLVVHDFHSMIIFN